MSIGVTNFPYGLDAVLDLVEATNNAVTTLSTTINNSATTITVASTADFPDTGILKIEDELIAYTAKTTTSPFEFTVQASPAGRGFEGTTAAGHTAGATVELVITARSNNVKNDAIIALETKLGTGDSAPVAPANGASFLRAFGTGESYWTQHTTADLGYARYDITSVATTTLTSSSPAVNEFYGTPSALRTVRLPVTLSTGSSPAEVGQSFVLINLTDNVFRVFNSANTEIGRVDIGQIVKCTCSNNATETVSNWLFSVEGYVNYGYGTVVRNSSLGDGVGFLGGAGSSSSHWSLRLTPATLSANRTLTLPDKNGTIITSADTGTVTASLIASNAVGTSKIIDSAVTPEKLSSVAQGLGSRNRLINGDFGVANRAMLVSTVATFSSTTRPANIDNQYTLDRWILLSNGDNRAIVTRASDAPTGQFTSCGLQVVGGTNKFGILQIIEQRNCVGLVGQPCTLSFKARYTGSNVNTANLRAAIVAWTGTADQPTRDIVSDWNNSSSTSNPTLVTSWEYVNTSPASLGISTTWTSYVIANVTIPSNATNVGVFLWSNATSLTANDYIYITDVQLEAGATATAFERLSLSAQQVLCAYYLQMISDVKVNALNGPQVLGYSLGSICDIPVRYNRVIRVPPTLILNGAVWSNTGGEPPGNTFTFFVPNVVAFATTTGTITFAVPSSTAIGALLRVTSTAAFSVTAGNIVNLTCGTTVNIYLDAEL